MWDALVAWRLNACWIYVEPMVGWFGQIGGNPKIVQIWRLLPLRDVLKIVKKSIGFILEL